MTVLSTAQSICRFESFPERLLVAVQCLHGLGCCGKDKCVGCLIGFCGGCEFCLEVANSVCDLFTAITPIPNEQYSTT